MITFSDFVGFLPVFLDDFYFDVQFQQPGSQIVGDSGSAHDHHFPQTAAFHGPELCKELFDFPGASGDRELVTAVDYCLAAGDDHLIVPLDDAELNTGSAPGIYFIDFPACQRTVLSHPALCHFHAAFGKGIHLDLRGIVQAADDFTGCCILGIHEHAQPQIIFDQPGAFVELRIPDPSNGAGCADAAAEQAGDNVGFICAGGCYDQIGSGHTGFPEDVHIRSASLHPDHIQIIQGMLQYLCLVFNHRDIMTFSIQLTDKGMADFADAHNDDIHEIPLL